MKKHLSLRYLLGFAMGSAMGIPSCKTTSPLWVEFIGAVIMCLIGHVVAMHIYQLFGIEPTE
jgi:hypothetical protein